MPTLCLKVDVDTFSGHREGVPALLRLFDRLDLRASFFFSLGPDNSGKALRRIFRPGFLAKMGRTKAVSTYGWRTVLSGTLLPAPLIVPSAPEPLRDAVASGHDCGVHAWDHVAWQDNLLSTSPVRLREDFDRALELFARVAGHEARSCAAPGWQTNAESLMMQEEHRFSYCSDVRTGEPFLPQVGTAVLRTPQIPTTLPTLDEIYGAPGLSEEGVIDLYLALLSQGDLHVHTVHAEMEGGPHLPLLEELLRRARNRGFVFCTLRDVAATLDRRTLPAYPVVQCPVEGRAGTVSMPWKRPHRTRVPLAVRIL